MGPGSITVVLAADDAYTMQATTAARSVIDTLQPDRKLHLVVLDMGMTDEHRTMMESSLRDPRVELTLVDSLLEKVGDLPNTWPTITRATYGRLYIPAVLPDTSRALYLDCDVLARHCVGDLVATDMDGAAALAVPDAQAPFVSSPYGVPFWLDAGRAADDPNFNAGVMLMDLDVWRDLGITDEALRYLTDGRHHFAQDQEAINAVLGTRIGRMDPRWNQQAEIFWETYAVIQPWPKPEVERLRAAPWIIHYANQPKPWHHGCEHPFLDEWFRTVDQTEFRGWRPPTPTLAKRAARSGARGVRKVARKLGLL